MNKTAHPATPPDATEFVIEASSYDSNYWRDVWRFRELMGFLAWRDIKIRYKQTVLGVAWAVAQPVMTAAIFTFVFGRLAKMPSGGMPYPLVVMSAQISWQLFANALSNSSGSLLGNAHLISKVYFPRIVLPFSALVVALIDFLIVFCVYLAMTAWFGVAPTVRWFALPLLVLATLLPALGMGLWLSALTVRFRDFRFIVPFILQIGAFVTPVGYRTDFFPNWQDLLALNPMTGVVESFRWCLLGGTDFLWKEFIVSMVISTVLLATGSWYFRSTERSFADII
jgi:lipopolysaccharide transport system permease protein